MTRVEKAILQEEERAKREETQKRKNFILKIVANIGLLFVIVALFMYGYVNYKSVDSSKNVSEQVGQMVETVESKKKE